MKDIKKELIDIISKADITSIDYVTFDKIKNMINTANNRQYYNKEILKIISELIERYPDLRFGQLIVAMVKASDIDFFNEESKDTFERLNAKYR